jgi:hypothetical protein
VIVSLLYTLPHALVRPAGATTPRYHCRDAELLVLRHNYAALRRQIGGPGRYEPAGRLWFRRTVPADGIDDNIASARVVESSGGRRPVPSFGTRRLAGSRLNLTGLGMATGAFGPFGGSRPGPSFRTP